MNTNIEESLAESQYLALRPSVFIRVHLWFYKRR